MSNGSMGYTELGNMKLNGKPPKKSWNVSGGWMKMGGFLAAVAVLVVLMVFGIVKIIGGGGYDSAIDEFVENVMVDPVNGGEVDAKRLKKQYPKFMNETIDELCDNISDKYEYSYNDMLGYLEDVLGDSFDAGVEIFKVTYEVNDKEKLDDEEIDEYQEEISSWAGDDQKVNVQAGYLVNIEFKGSLKNKYNTLIEEEIGQEIEDTLVEMDLIVLKCNGKTGVWKMDGYYIWDDWF